MNHKKKSELNIFERHYRKYGIVSQRRYPNESLVAFFGSHYFTLSLASRARIKVLEVGCGSGANLWMVAKEGFDAQGIDFSPTGLRYCRRLLRAWGVSVKLTQGDFTQLPFTENDFNIIFDVVSLQHLTFDQHQKAYQEIFRCLKPRGKFYSYHLGENSISLKSTPRMLDHCTVQNIAAGFPLANNGQTCFLSANEVRKLLAEVGFKKIIIEKVVRSYANQTAYVEYLSVEAQK